MSLIRSSLRLLLAVGVIGSCLSLRAVPVDVADDAGVETAKTLYQQMGGHSGEVAATPATPLTAMPDPLAAGGSGTSASGGLRTQDLILAGIEGKTVPAGTAATRAVATEGSGKESNGAAARGGWVLFGMVVVGFVLAGLALGFSARQQQEATGSGGRRG